MMISLNVICSSLREQREIAHIEVCNTFKAYIQTFIHRDLNKLKRQ